MPEASQPLSSAAERHLRRALALAVEGRATAAPNPCVGAVVVEAQDEAAVHLDPVVVEQAYAGREVPGLRGDLAGLLEVRVGE